MCEHDAQVAQVQILLILSFFYCGKIFFKSLKPNLMQKISRPKLGGSIVKKKDRRSIIKKKGRLEPRPKRKLQG